MTSSHAMVDPVHGPLRAALAHRYLLLEECGRGGTSVVYRARDVQQERDVAVKVMLPELSNSTTAERFLREVRIAGTLEHPHIASLLDSGEAAGQLYCVLPYIDGETLRQRITREGPLPVDDALRVARQVGAALEYAHARGIVHRDVKPENILLSQGHAVLSDFGIARAVVVAAGERLTDSGIAIGTPSYMSPEQAAASSELDARSDEYALAVCLYEMLAGDPPFVGRTAQAIIARQLTEAPPRLEVARPTVAPGIVAAIERALSKVPGDRYRSVGEFLAALESCDTIPIRPGAPVSRRTVAALAVAALAGIGAVGWWFAHRVPAVDATRVVVFPARTGAANSDPEEGLRVADAIQVAVEHTEPLRWLPAWDYL
ncbi:MAG TPA: serine/threonine-protein kinase, partial [Gemmatimonadaceae bacterium]|nr:serine/threonine-protein kinase [Gemmatimonadaceae bacterium]